MANVSLIARAIVLSDSLEQVYKSTITISNHRCHFCCPSRAHKSAWIDFSSNYTLPSFFSLWLKVIHRRNSSSDIGTSKMSSHIHPLLQAEEDDQSGTVGGANGGGNVLNRIDANASMLGTLEVCSRRWSVCV